MRKAVFDWIVALVVLIAVSPLFIVLALAIKCDSPGPVFFRQKRVGRSGRVFRIHKFRSLRTGTAGPNISPAGDSRVTRVGRFIRKTKLDELAQLIDILQGHMSLVGPRPEVPGYVAQWSEAVRPIILSVRPGITDEASIRLRNESELLAAAEDPEKYYVEVLLPEKTAMYVNYVRSRTFMGDLSIIVRTIKEVVFPA